MRRWGGKVEVDGMKSVALRPRACSSICGAISVFVGDVARACSLVRRGGTPYSIFRYFPVIFNDSPGASILSANPTGRVVQWDLSTHRFHIFLFPPNTQRSIRHTHSFPFPSIPTIQRSAPPTSPPLPSPST